MKKGNIVLSKSEAIALLNIPLPSTIQSGDVRDGTLKIIRKIPELYCPICKEPPRGYSVYSTSWLPAIPVRPFSSGGGHYYMGTHTSYECKTHGSYTLEYGFVTNDAYWDFTENKIIYSGFKEIKAKGLWG
jgi:hypothetical protein